MQDAIADTNNSAPGKDRLSYNMFKHLSEKTLSIFLLFIKKNILKPFGVMFTCCQFPQNRVIFSYALRHYKHVGSKEVV
jgi:hypothetical protein